MDKKDRTRLNHAYMETYKAYKKATEEDQKEALLETMRTIVQHAAEGEGFQNTIPEQTSAYKLRVAGIPKKTVKVYKVFTLSDDGAPTALFISGTEKLPKGVWLDARDAFHFTAKNGRDYVPSTQNPYTDGGKTGASIEIPSDTVREELIARGFLQKGSKAKKITALAYRPGWHAGTLPFFPQGGRKAPKGNPYPNVHRYNQVVFECEIAADTDYTETARSQEKARKKDGRLNAARADLQYMPRDGFYYYATNPLTQNNPNLGAWTISGSMKINRALTQEECDTILKAHGMEPQAWEQGEMQLDALGYTSDQSEAMRKTLAPITYDDMGNIIPLAKRFDAAIQDVRYQEEIGRKATHLTKDIILDEKDKRLLKESLGEDGMRVYQGIERTLANGNLATKNAASVSAAILASHAKAWSETDTGNANKYLDTVKIAISKTAGSAEQHTLEAVLYNWNQNISDYAASDEEKWKIKRNGELLPVMKTPLALQLLGAPFEDLHIFGSFYAHCLKHNGMNLDLLRELPKKMLDPVMIVRGGAPNSYVLAIELDDKNSAPIVTSVGFGKHYDEKQSRASIINTAFGKTRHWDDDRPSLRWFQNNLESGNVLYLNKKKSTQWFESHENSSLASAEALSALSGFIISERMQKVKTEKDLENIKNEYSGRYQSAYSRIQGSTDFLMNGKRIVNLFQSADETTFLHETAHVLYDDLKKSSTSHSLAKQDFNVVSQWAEWNEKQLQEYQDTPWYNEFSRRDRAIRSAIQRGDKNRETALREEWREERFARGFERYLEQGKAPTHTLRRVFDRCKRLFKNAYHAFRGEGGRATPEVETIMARLITPESTKALVAENLINTIEAKQEENRYFKKPAIKSIRLDQTGLRKSSSRELKALKKTIQEAYGKRYREAVDHKALAEQMNAILRKEYPDLKELAILQKIEQEEKRLKKSREQESLEDTKRIKACQKHAEQCDSQKKAALSRVATVWSSWWRKRLFHVNHDVLQGYIMNAKCAIESLKEAEKIKAIHEREYASKAGYLADCRRKAQSSYDQYLQDGCLQVAEAYVKGLSNRHDAISKLDAYIAKAEDRENADRKAKHHQNLARKKHQQDCHQPSKQRKCR